MFVTLQDLNSSRYDAFIAGSGPAGAVVAKHMERLGKTVLVVESGGRGFETSVQDSYGVVHGRGHFPSGYWSNHWIRVLGGTSMVWQGWVTTLRDRNMRDWPITRDELTRWYDIAAAELGRPALISSWEAPAVDGFLSRPFSMADPNRYGEESGEGIWNADNVHVLLNATLSRLHPRADRRGIERVTLHSDLGVDPSLLLTGQV